MQLIKNLSCCFFFFLFTLSFSAQEKKEQEPPQQEPSLMLPRGVSLKELPEVEKSSALKKLETSPFFISLSKEKKIYIQGILNETKDSFSEKIKKYNTTWDKQQPPEKLKSLKTSSQFNVAPVTLNVHSSLAFRDIMPLFERLLRNYCLNLRFLVRTSEGLRTISLPVMVDQGLSRRGVSFTFCDGNYFYQTNETIEKVVWINTTVGKGGKTVLRSIEISEEGPLHVEELIEEDSIVPDFPKRKRPEKETKGPEDPEVKKYIKEDGSCDLVKLKAFLQEKRKDKYPYFIKMKISWNDNLEDFLGCLSSLKDLLEHGVLVIVSAKDDGL